MSIKLDYQSSLFSTAVDLLSNNDNLLKLRKLSSKVIGNYQNQILPVLRNDNAIKRTYKKSNTVILCFLDDTTYSVGIKSHNKKQNGFRNICLKSPKIEFYIIQKLWLCLWQQMFFENIWGLQKKCTVQCAMHIVHVSKKVWSIVVL